MYNKYVFHLQADMFKHFNVISVQSQCARLLRAQHLHTPQPDYGLQRPAGMMRSFQRPCVLTFGPVRGYTLP